MEVDFQDSELEEMANDSNYKGNWSPAIVKALRKRLNFIKQAIGQQDLYAFRSNHLEKLKGQRHGQHSIRLNNQYRLIIQFKTRQGKKIVSIIKIEDYH